MTLKKQAENLGDVRDVDLAVGERVPGMRIGFALDLQRRHTFRGNEDLRLGAGVFDQGLRPGLEAQTVDEDLFGYLLDKLRFFV
ncbi:hypothetical protein AFK68_21135 [Hydrocoleum sp. CS-953]|nr:hypothetical protein AFK68_21135 [Hydrocoleum sp. CS-953]